MLQGIIADNKVLPKIRNEYKGLTIRINKEVKYFSRVGYYESFIQFINNIYSNDQIHTITDIKQGIIELLNEIDVDDVAPRDMVPDNAGNVASTDEIYVYVDIIESQIIGDYLIRCLRIVDSKKTYQTFNPIYYCKINVKHIENIEILLASELGEGVPNGTLPSRITLEFKKVR